MTEEEESTITYKGTEYTEQELVAKALNTFKLAAFNFYFLVLVYQTVHGDYWWAYGWTTVFTTVYLFVKGAYQLLVSDAVEVEEDEEQKDY